MALREMNTTGSTADEAKTAMITALATDMKTIGLHFIPTEFTSSASITKVGATEETSLTGLFLNFKSDDESGSTLAMLVDTDTDGTFATTSGARRMRIYYYASENGLFFYNSAGIAFGAIIHFGSREAGTESITSSMGGDYQWKNYRNASAIEWPWVFTINSTLDSGYIAIAPIISRDTQVSNMGDSAGDVLSCGGIQNDTWATGGTVINDVTYHGYKNLCTTG